MTKRSLRRALGTVALVALVLMGVRPVHAELFEAHGFTLANGLQIVVIPNHRAPIVTQMVWYKVGAADEPLGKSGIAHFLEHLMFRGTATVPPGAFSRIVAENGGRDNAFTTEDYTAFYEEVASDRLELLMKLEADRMANLVITDKVVLPERDVIIEERRQRIDNNPAALFAEQLRTALFLNHPYRIPTIGWEGDMQRLDRRDAQDFYHRWYAPNNAVLVVAGDATPERVKALAEKYFGVIPARAVPDRVRPIEPPKVAAARLTMRSRRVTAVNWSRQYLAPSYRAGDKQYAYALQVLAGVLGGSAASPLYKGLVVDHRLALAAGAFYDPDAYDLGTFGFSATLADGAKVADFEAAIDAIVNAALAGGITAAEVARAESRMQAAAVYARDSLAGPARLVGEALAAGRSLDDVESWPDRIGAVTLDQVQKAAHLVIRDDVAVTGVLMPGPTS